MGWIILRFTINMRSAFQRLALSTICQSICSVDESFYARISVKSFRRRRVSMCFESKIVAARGVHATMRR